MAILIYSVVIPVYRNADNIDDLSTALTKLSEDLDGQMEAIFVVDGSPDSSLDKLLAFASAPPFPIQILVHSRNFGSFAAIRTGLGAATGRYMGVMAADLQEPPELMLSFFESLAKDECDVAVGVRTRRDDPFLSRIVSHLFWAIYRYTVLKDMPVGGVDIFSCKMMFRNELLKLSESRSSLVALVFWLGFRRKCFPYNRQKRTQGKSSWTIKKKIEYMTDSIFAFTDLPIKMLFYVGLFGVIFSGFFGVLVALLRSIGVIEVPGYAGTIIMVLFFGMLNLFSLGIVGTYAWRAYENSKQRPLAVIARHLKFDKG